MKILVINCGSSSLKYQLIDIEKEDVLCKGLAERIGIEGSRVVHEPTGMEKVTIEEAMPDHKKAIEIVLNSVAHPEYGVIKSMDEIAAVGHRVVHGGEVFNDSTLLTDEVMDKARECIDLAPLHNPANIMGIEACKELMPDTPMVGVFDTAFHQTMPAVNYIYAIPYEYYEKYAIRRYGFHGTSHKYVTERAADILGIDLDKINLITCHLGNGSSITCIEGGKSRNTTMGLTPLEGLVMGTRCGDIDPAIIPFIGRKENLDYDGVDNMMNKESGVYGVSGISSDFRDLEDAAKEGNERAKLSLDMFESKVKKYIGAYMTEIDHTDAIVFTAGIGENSISMRESICKSLEHMGIKIDPEKNNVRGKECIVSADDSPIKILVIPTNEELMIAKDTMNLVK
ncbi:MAG: acetate kinase [Tissierellia bacterium]|nr:acetate kinase [Tissierellia bacterium]